VQTPRLSLEFLSGFLDSGLLIRCLEGAEPDGFLATLKMSQLVDFGGFGFSAMPASRLLKSRALEILAAADRTARNGRTD